MWLTITHEERRNAIRHGVPLVACVYGACRAGGMGLTGEPITCAQALAYNLVNYVSDEGSDGDAKRGQKAFQEKRKSVWQGL